MDNFYKEAELLHNDRVVEQRQQREKISTRAKQEFSKFCVWCRTLNDDPTEANFKFYLKTENLKLDFWVLKQIFETFFNYEYKFDYGTKKWLVKKIR